MNNFTSFDAIQIAHHDEGEEEAETQARMSTLQRNELSTQSEILEKETLPPAKEAHQHSEAEPYEAKHHPRLYFRIFQILALLTVF